MVAIATYLPGRRDLPQRTPHRPGCRNRLSMVPHQPARGHARAEAELNSPGTRADAPNQVGQDGTVVQDHGMDADLETPTVQIREAGLLLRPWRPEDEDAVYRACQDPQIHRWTNVPRPYLREHAHQYV